MDLGAVRSAALRSGIPYALDIVDFITDWFQRVSFSAKRALQADLITAFIADERGSVQGYAKMLHRLRRESDAANVTDAKREIGISVRQILAIVALAAIGYTCIHALSFTVRVLNLILACAIYAIPFLAIRPVMRLPRRPRTWGWGLLAPLLFLSSFLLLSTVVLEGLLGQSEEKEPLQTFQEGSSTFQLQRYEFGGAIGVHGINLEQRRLIVPGLYLVRSVAFFDSASDGTLSVEGPYMVRVHAKGNYYSYDYQADNVYHLKPWIYF